MFKSMQKRLCGRFFYVSGSLNAVGATLLNRLNGCDDAAQAD